MKRILLASAFAALLIGAQSVIAQDLGLARDYEQKWQGMGIGALVGAIVGGPPGLIIGAASGGLFGHQQGLEFELQSAQQQIKSMEVFQSKVVSDLQQRQLEVTRLQQLLAQGKLHQADNFAATQQQYVARLDAIVQGFLFNIQFRTESAVLEPHFEQQLDRAVATLKAFPELTVHVDAYADRRGTAAFNKTLTQQRVNAVVRRLRAAGVSATRIRQLSLGESRAEYLMQDAEGMGFDRRVLLYFCRS